MKFGDFVLFPYLCGMGRYLIKDESSTALRNLIKKYSKEIPVNTDRLRGTFTIKSFRKYKYDIEVDVVFKGEIHARVGLRNEWFKSDITKPNTKYKISKVKLNRLIRKSLERDVRINLNYFSETLRYYSDIKKIEWL